MKTLASHLANKAADRAIREPKHINTMKTFACFYPAKIIVAQYELPLERIPNCEAPLYVAPEGWRYYYSQEKGRMAKDKAEGSCMIFVEVSGHFSPVTSTPADNVAAFCERQGPRVLENLPKWASDLAEPAAYEARAREAIAKRHAEREIADREQAERNQRRAEAAEAAHKASLVSFLSGQPIPWSVFERGCKDNGIKMPIRTIGMARESVTSISLNSMSTRGKKNSPHIWIAVRALASLLNESAPR